jgi:hypothetical protein
VKQIDLRFIKNLVDPTLPLFGARMWQWTNPFSSRMKIHGLGRYSDPLHNCYLDETNFIEDIQVNVEVEKVINFSGTYYLLSQVANAALTPSR